MVFQFLSRLIKKQVEPKIYAVRVLAGAKSFTKLLAAYSLEDAIKEVKKEAAKAIPDFNPNQFVLDGYVFASLNELLSPFLKDEIKKEEVVASKDQNSLMQEIIKEGDLDLLERSKAELGEVNVKYVLEKIKEKKK